MFDVVFRIFLRERSSFVFFFEMKDGLFRILLRRSRFGFFLGFRDGFGIFLRYSLFGFFFGMKDIFRMLFRGRSECDFFLELKVLF